MSTRGALLAITLSACASTQTPPPPTPRAAEAPLVVSMVVDQFPAWMVADRIPMLPDDGGFARLRREGTWHRQLRYLHAATDTAPGHSSLFTGQPPRETGILANELPNGRGGRDSILDDPNAHAVTPTEVTDATSSSIARLRVETVADELRARVPEAVIVSVSLKDRGAIFGGGRHPDATLWFDPRRGSFVTSTAFSPRFPAWAVGPGGAEAITAARPAAWTLLDAPWVRDHAATPDAQPGEGDLDGWGTTFPHAFASSRRPNGALRASPFGDEAVLRLAVAAAREARRPGRPMLLAVSLSSNDYIGHVFGPDSWEAWDQLRRLDASLARFFRELDAIAGERGWSLVLSGDHGMTPLPEVLGRDGARPWCREGAPNPWERGCAPPSRLDPDALGPELQAAAVTAIGPGTWVLGVVDPYVYLTPEARALPAPRRATLREALVRQLRNHPEVERVVDAETVPETCADGEAVDALICRSIPHDSGATLYVQTRAGAFFDAGYTVGFGASHGSPYLYDRAVPLFVRAPGQVDAGAASDTPVPFTRYRASVAGLLGLAAMPR
ncbi:MAG: alkaline phosphatase family protein [Polyangiales bacterium]